MKCRFEAVETRLKDLGLNGTPEFWNAVRAHIETVNETKDWWNLIYDATAVIEESDKEFISQARESLPAEPWDGDTWSQWISVVKDQTGRKGKELFMPLRKALTGQSHGPELATILPLIGREKTLDRLS